MPYGHGKVSNNVDNRDRGSHLRIRIDRMIDNLSVDRWWWWLLIDSGVGRDRLDKVFRGLVVDGNIFGLRDEVGGKVDGGKLVSINLIMSILVIFILLFGSHLVHFKN